ncbi:MAG: right-handed parallel beta-helix repeat-containing protein, partial [Thermoplasmata archaeon]|nr:right-handed parallel beta-helix repeat-containing protein [Thermoplasmata archaeon]
MRGFFAAAIVLFLISPLTGMWTTGGEGVAFTRGTHLIENDLYIDEDTTYENCEILVNSSESKPITIQINSTATLYLKNVTINSPQGWFSIIAYGRIVIINSTVEHIGRGRGISLSIYSDNSYLYNVSFTDFTSAVTVYGANNVTIESCHFAKLNPPVVSPKLHTPDIALQILTAANCTVKNTTFYGLKGGKGVVDPDTNIALDGNHVVGIYIGSSLNISLENCTLSKIVGGKGAPPTSISKGGDGGSATGVEVSHSAKVVLQNVTVGQVVGGDGGSGMGKRMG